MRPFFNILLLAFTTNNIFTQFQLFLRRHEIQLTIEPMVNIIISYIMPISNLACSGALVVGPSLGFLYSVSADFSGKMKSGFILGPRLVFLLIKLEISIMTSPVAKLIAR